MKLLGSTKIKTTIDGNSENVPHLKKFVSNKSFGHLLNVWPKRFIFLITFDSEFLCIKVWFTYENSKSLEIEDKINITLVINSSLKYKKWCDIHFKQEVKALKTASKRGIQKTVETTGDLYWK